MTRQIVCVAFFMACSSSNELEQEKPIFPSYTCENAVFEDWTNSKYVLPYPVAKKYKVDLANCSSSYHSTGRPDQFAYDFNMPVGTLITASRAGKVITVVEDGKEYSRNNNFITVKHEDSSESIYMHLTKNGAIVGVGDFVSQGDSIAYSGATGLAGYPHLHFIVIKNYIEWPYEGIPINFKNTSPNPKGLQSNTEYEALDY